MAGDLGPNGNIINMLALRVEGCSGLLATTDAVNQIVNRPQ